MPHGSRLPPILLAGLAALWTLASLAPSPALGEDAAAPDSAVTDSLAGDTLQVAPPSAPPADTLALEPLPLLPPTTAVLADTMRFRLEMGASSDYTNEVYYLDALVDTTFLRRQRFSTPQGRYAGVVLTALDGTRRAQKTSYSLLNEISLGDRLRRDTAFGTWRSTFAPGWWLVATPRAEYRWDRTLDRDFEEYLGHATVRVRRNFDDGATSAEVGLQGEILRTTGAQAGLLTDRNAGAALFALDHVSLTGADWRGDYVLRARTFPDSSVRDHFEHETSLRGRWSWGAGHSAAVEVGSTRRVTVRVAPTTLDNFWEERFTADVLFSSGVHWSWPIQIEAEAQQYDLEDTLTYFNYEVVRVKTGARTSPSVWWSVTAGPRGEFLRSVKNPQESYREVAGFCDLEVVGARTLWSVIPAAGWRHYTFRGGNELDGIAAHSPYGFVELELLIDQPILESWRVRVAATGRDEFHTESIEDGASLYFSVDVRRLF